jgi:LmbE family N-acetylglucosaminyl deacetylase
MMRPVDNLIRKLKPGWTRRLSSLLDARYERFAPLEMLPAPSGGQLVVIAAHPDDESIGCGGLVAAWRAGGGTVTVCVLTDGAAGDPALRDPDLPAAERSDLAATLVARRRAETEDALAVLGAQAVWFDGTDGSLAGDVDRIAGALGRHLRQNAPDAIAAPFPADRHADHAAASRILAATDLAGTLPVFGYEVWSPALANAVLDITDWADAKWAAIACHRSQTATTDYAAALRGLATYRAVSAGLGADRYAEAYWKTTLAQYRGMTRAMTV